MFDEDDDDFDRQFVWLCRIVAVAITVAWAAFIALVAGAAWLAVKLLSHFEII